jgi:hypothetical protein
MIQLNSQAVTLMQEGAYSAAFTLLHSSLDQLKTKVDTELESVDDMPTMGEEASIHPIPVRFARHDEKVTNNAFSFYSSACVFIGTESELLTTSLNEIRLAAVVLYNLALCFHVHGIGRAASQHYFTKALQMYKTALGLLKEVATVSPKQVEKDSLLRLALYNNIGHIHSCDHQTADLQRCLEKIQSILANESHATQPSESDCQSASSTRQDYLEFHLNVIILHGTRRHSPAA